MAFSRLLVVLIALTCELLAAGPNVRPNSREIVAVLKTIAIAIADDYYDERVAVEIWPKIEANYEKKIRAAGSKSDALRLIRQMLSELHNSHILFYSREEWAMRQNVLPFSFERVGNRVFVSKTFSKSRLEFGDEIISIDGNSPFNLEPRNLIRLDEVSQNPLYGEANTIAALKIVRDGKEFNLQVRRVSSGETRLQLQEFKPGVAYLALDECPDSAASQELQETWKKAISSKAVILDLRDCSGGWPSTAEYLLDSGLGHGHARFTMEDRRGKTLPPEPPFAAATRYTGYLFVLQWNAQSYLAKPSEAVNTRTTADGEFCI